jgi:2,3-dihydroxyphenylpropionate 1,2-dioxygenase
MEIAGLVAMSHTPSWDLSFDHRGPGERYVSAVGEARRLVAQLEPDVLVVFGPDHFRNFFYDAMPPFCVGAEAVEGFGDYSSPKGRLPGHPELGRFIVEAVMSAGFDPAISLKMGIDHGITQPYAALAGERSPRLVPIMVNCGGGPMPSLRRCHAFGRAVGDAIRAFPEVGRALVVGSGGLSHSPPSVSPFDPSVSADVRDYVINGRPRASEFNAAREKQSIERRKAGGVGPINSSWDEWFLDHLRSGDLEPVLRTSADELLREAGVGGQEVRTWIAAVGAWGRPIEHIAYEPVPGWITGMGCVTATGQQLQTETA